MTPRMRHLLWCAAQVLIGLVTFMAFFNFAPWLATRSIAEAPPEALHNLPQGCPAFSVNHGTYICEWHDTIEKNPMGFGICAGILALGLGFIYFTAFTGRGFAMTPFWGRKVKPKSDIPPDGRATLE
jgi:hypothetical protein